MFRKKLTPKKVKLPQPANPHEDISDFCKQVLADSAKWDKAFVETYTTLRLFSCIFLPITLFFAIKHHLKENFFWAIINYIGVGLHTNNIINLTKKIKTNKMRALIIDEAIKNTAAAVVKHAEENVFSMDDLLDISNGSAKSVGNRDGFTFEIPMGYKVVYSIENQVKGKLRHLSVSVDTPGKTPHPQAVSEIMKLVGFENDISEVFNVSLEPLDGGITAVNVIEVIEFYE